jgi:hypothetical protein
VSLTHSDPATAPEVIADPDPNSAVSRQIASGASHNLLHLARPVDEKTGKIKSAITVDEVRRAGRFFSQTSGTGNWRIVIIDPADDMNRSAANAILKISWKSRRSARCSTGFACAGQTVADDPLAMPAAEAETRHPSTSPPRFPIRTASRISAMPTS